MIEVCCAIIIEGSKMLAVQRGPKSHHPWKWEFPGGKINALETAEQCIVREIEEELKVRVEISESLSAVEFNYGKWLICLVPFLCRIVEGEIQLSEHVAQRWIAFQEWETLDWLEADRELILKNRERLQIQLAVNDQETNDKVYRDLGDSDT